MEGGTRRKIVMEPTLPIFLKVISMRDDVLFLFFYFKKVSSTLEQVTHHSCHFSIPSPLTRPTYLQLHLSTNLHFLWFRPHCFLGLGTDNTSFFWGFRLHFLGLETNNVQILIYKHSKENVTMVIEA